MVQRASTCTCALAMAVHMKTPSSTVCAEIVPSVPRFRARVRDRDRDRDRDKDRDRDRVGVKG